MRDYFYVSRLQHGGTIALWASFEVFIETLKPSLLLHSSSHPAKLHSGPPTWLHFGHASGRLFGVAIKISRPYYIFATVVLMVLKIKCETFCTNGRKGLKFQN